MKKLTLLLMTIVTVMVLVACAQSKQVNKPVKNEELVGEQPVKEPVELDEPVKTPDETDTIVPKQKRYENKAFKDVVVTESDGQIIVTGKARVFEGVFQYRLSDGGQVLLEDHYQTDGAPAWGDFSINFEKSLLTPDQAIFELFVYSAKDGAKVDVLEIPME